MKFQIYSFNPLNFAIKSFQLSPTSVQNSTWREQVAGTVAMMDGTIFTDCSVPHCGRANYLAMDTRTGVNYASKHPKCGMTYSFMKDGSIQVADGASVSKGCFAAIQMHPEVVRNGKNVANQERSSCDMTPSGRTDYTERAALCITHDGKVAFAVGNGSISAFANDLIKHGIKHAGYTDGGGSTKLIVKGVLNGAQEDRAVPMWLVELDPTAQSSRNSLLSMVASHISPSLGWLLKQF